MGHNMGLFQGGRNRSVEDFENDGFTVYTEEDDDDTEYEVPEPTPTKVVTKKSTKVVIIDNKDIVHAVSKSTEVLKSLVNYMASKPQSFTLNIKRDDRGFMSSIEVKTK